MPTIKTEFGVIGYSWNGVDDGGPALILIHGAGGQARDWPTEWRYRTNGAQTLGVRALPTTFAFTNRPVYALDLPGHGASEPSANATVDHYSDVVASWISTIGLNRPVLVGHSLGGAIALTVAIRHSAAISGLVILGSAAKMPVTDQILDGLRQDFDATVDMIVKFSWPKDAVAVFREIGRRHMKACGPDTVFADFAMCADYDVSGALGEIRVPVLVVAGEKDRMVPAKASGKLSDALPDSELQTVPGAGHFMHFDKPGAVGRLIDRFLDRSIDRFRGP